MSATAMTFFKTEAAAAKLAATCNADDDTSTYRVEPSPGRPGQFLIVVYDEDGFPLGPL